MKHKIIVSLCDYSGTWCQPYRNAGYSVWQVDPKLDSKEGYIGLTAQQFVKEYKKYFSSVYGVLAAPPCTDFSGSGAQYWEEKDLNGNTALSLQIVDACLEFIQLSKPKFWVLENPVGRLRSLRPQLGEPYSFNPHEFAGFMRDKKEEAYTKYTQLFGRFNRNLKKSIVKPVHGSLTLKQGHDDVTDGERSKTPKGFARAFFFANM